MNTLMDIKSDLKKVDDRFESLNMKVDNMASRVNENHRTITELCAQNAKVCERMLAMEDKMDDYESRSRRNNLIFHGIAEEKGETWDLSEDENVSVHEGDTEYY